jgi:thiol-disulfide isomerase/thioredoxin
MAKDKNKSTRRSLIEWGIFLGIAGVLYLTGLHTEVIGGLQRLILATGIIRPDTESESLGKAGNFTMSNLATGETIQLEDLGGKTVFLNFWATWCPPCIAEMPDIQNLYEEINDKNIVFVMLNLDDDREKARDFIQRKEFTFPVYFLESAVPEIFSTRSIPTTFVIGPDGNVRLKKAGMANYNNQKFIDFLKELNRSAFLKGGTD